MPRLSIDDAIEYVDELQALPAGYEVRDNAGDEFRKESGRDTDPWCRLSDRNGPEGEYEDDAIELPAVISGLPPRGSGGQQETAAPTVGDMVETLFGIMALPVGTIVRDDEDNDALKTCQGWRVDGLEGTFANHAIELPVTITGLPLRAPVPRPSNQLLQQAAAWFIENANEADPEDCEPCGLLEDACPVHYGAINGIQWITAKLQRVCEDPELLSHIPEELPIGTSGLQN